MKKSVCVAWIEALRSGNYKQHRGMLADDYGSPTAFCCLGLLAHIDGVNLEEEAVGYKTTHEKLDQYNCLIKTHTMTQQLYFMNDGASLFVDKKHSFPEIADYIEANILPNCTEE